MDNIKASENLNATAVVPSLNPDEKLCGVVNNLIEAGFDDIIVIDDGSAPEYKKNFPEESSIVTLLVHEVNRGKGAAMKTAFRHILSRPSSEIKAGVVTVDGDGQHRADDVCACVKAMTDGEPALVLGSRNFDLPNVPSRSRKGNKITSAVFKLLFGMKLKDTQTGLRAIPTQFLPKMLEIGGDRYEYETNMLMGLKPAGIPVKEVQIETVYINDNKTSHFRTVRDSVRVYGLIIKYVLSSVSSALIDYLSFYGFEKLYILLGLPFDDYLAAGSARLISSVFNFTLNRNAVFKGKGNTGKLILKYYALAIPLLCVSALCVHYIGELLGGMPLVKALVKIPVDLILFIISFRIQREWVFKDEQDK